MLGAFCFIVKEKTLKKNKVILYKLMRVLV